MGKPSNNKVYEFENFRLDAAHLMLYRESEEVPLSPKAAETLLVLIEQRGNILSKDELMQAVWADSFVEESNLAQYIHVLRKTLGNQRTGKPFIETLRRRGYRFSGDVKVTIGSNGSATDDQHNKRNLNYRGFNIQKRGNVLALADWKEAEPALSPESAPTAQPFAGRKTGFVSPSKYRGLYLVLAVIAALCLGTFAIFYFRSASKAENLPPKRELTVLNLTNGEPMEQATISPDGNYFVYASRDGERTHLWLQQTGQATRIEITEAFAGAVGGTSFSPDSQFVYFVADDAPGSPWTLYRVPALGGVKTKILADLATAVSFSPDGSEMVFIRGDAKAGQSWLIVASSDGTRERILVTRKLAEFETMNGGGAWSPDGKSIAYGLVDLTTPWRGACTIVATDTQTGETKSLSAEKWDTCYRMAWTRDGKGLVFIGTKSKESFSTRRDQIYYLPNASGESHRLTTDGNRHDYNSLGVTDSDEILAVPLNRLSQIWSMDASGDTRTAAQITRGLADGRGGIAPLGDGRVAFLTRNGDGFSIWLMNADGSGRKQLTTDPPEIQEVRASPDGSFFVFSVQRDGWDHLYRIDSDGANLRQLTFGNRREGDSAVSPDANWIVYASIVFDNNSLKHGLWKIPAGGGEPTALAAGLDCTAPQFSPDGRYVSCISPDWKKVSIVSADEGVAVNSFPITGNPILIGGARWTPDGQALAYVMSSENTCNIQLQPIDGSSPYPLTNFTSGDIYNFEFSRDGKRLYLARGNSVRDAVLIKNFR